MLTKRQKEILLALVKHHGFVTAEWVSLELGVSDRTVRTEIKEIQQRGKSLGISIESIRGKGYKLEIKNSQLFHQEFELLTEEALDEKQIDFSDQNNRIIYILKQFLLEKEPIKVEYFENKMFVSKPTVQNDLKIIREILARYKLKLITRPHYGTRVEGDEYMQRLCFSNYILSRNDDLNIDSSSFQILDKKLFEIIKEIIIKKVNDYQIEISDISLENLATHITIACKRIEEGFVIENIDPDLAEKYPFEKVVAEEIISEVEAFSGFIFPNSEIDYIIVHLLGTKLLHKDALKEYSEFDDIGTIIQSMLERLRIELNWDFRDDIEFIQALTLHIRPAMNRLRYNLNIRNPLLNEIKIKYPIAFEGAIVASTCMEEYLSLKIGEHEIAYIALHIGAALERMKTKNQQIKRVIVVCASGIGSAKVLFYRLKKLFKEELEIVASTSYYQLKKYDLSSVDFIISTIPIKEDIGVPIQVVNTFLEAGDIEHIRDKLAYIKKEKKPIYLDESRVFIHKDFENKERVIQFMCNELYKQGLVSKDYVKLVLERESLAPTSFGNLAAIPHPSTPETEETFWTVCTLKRPIQWNNDHMVQFVCLLNIRKGPLGDLDTMYEKLVTVLEDKSIIRRIIKSESGKEITEILN